MGELQNPLEERKVEMGLIFKLTLEGLFLLAKVITGAPLHVDENSRQTDPFEIGPVFSIEGLAAGTHETVDTRSFKPG
jgi:hypothetical protein